LQRQRAHVRLMMKRATQRPEKFVKPAHWTDTPPPDPADLRPSARQEQDEDPDGLSPTRYGDWVKNGIAIDF